MYKDIKIQYILLQLRDQIELFTELQPAPPVGFNLTFMCPEGQVCLLMCKEQNTNPCAIVQINLLIVVEKTQCKTMDNSLTLQVFDHDWFATPFVMLTCQVCAINIKQKQIQTKIYKVNFENSSLYWWERLHDSFFFNAIFFFPLIKGCHVCDIHTHM